MKPYLGNAGFPTGEVATGRAPTGMSAIRVPLVFHSASFTLRPRRQAREFQFGVGQGGASSQSARGLAQSKTLRETMADPSVRQLLDCASPLALSQAAGATPTRYESRRYAPPRFRPAHFGHSG